MFGDKKDKKENKEQLNENAAKKKEINVSDNSKKKSAKEEKMIKVKESDYTALQQEAGEYKDKYLRLFAEFDNARKRMDREKLDFTKYANGELIEQFLSVLDDLERSVEAARANHQDYTAFLKGIELVMAQLYEMLKKNNVKPIEAKGKKFNPNLHEALMQEETDQVDEDAILEEFQKGYMLGDRVVRTSKVKVAKSKSVQQDVEESAQQNVQEDIQGESLEEQI